MIFVTVGSQLPFDRLVMTMDEWAGLNKETKVVVQMGKTDFIAKHCQINNYIEPVEWEKLLREAEMVIAHAGMGTILKCIDNQKPLVIVPREWKLGEVRNDHQLATASKFTNMSGVFVVNDKDSLFKSIDTILNEDQNSTFIKSGNLERLISELKKFVM